MKITVIIVSVSDRCGYASSFIYYCPTEIFSMYDEKIHKILKDYDDYLSFEEYKERSHCTVIHCEEPEIKPYWKDIRQFIEKYEEDQIKSNNEEYQDYLRLKEKFKE